MSRETIDAFLKNGGPGSIRTFYGSINSVPVIFLSSDRAEDMQELRDLAELLGLAPGMSIGIRADGTVWMETALRATLTTAGEMVSVPAWRYEKDDREGDAEYARPFVAAKLRGLGIAVAPVEWSEDLSVIADRLVRGPGALFRWRGDITEVVYPGKPFP